MLRIVVLIAVLVVQGGCGEAEASKPTAVVCGLVFENTTKNDVIVRNFCFGTNPVMIGAMVIGPGAKSTIMGRIAAVRGAANFLQIDGDIGDPAVRVELTPVNHVGPLDRLVLRLSPEGTWTLMGEANAQEVFRAEETGRSDVPAAVYMDAAYGRAPPEEEAKP